MRFTNRFTITQPIDEVYFEDTSVFVTIGETSYALPYNTLTSRISADPDIPYEVEYHTPTMLLSALREPGLSYLYRIPDDQLFILGRSPAYVNRLFLDGRTLDTSLVAEDMIKFTNEEYMTRIRSLPSSYMEKYFIYELKVSYLASSPPKPYLFDPTQQELSAAVALSLDDNAGYLPLIPYTST